MSSESATQRALERRRERRIVVHLPMTVRGIDRDGVRFEELTTSQNLCRGGAAFATVHPLDPGADLEITIPLPKQGRQAENDFATRGRVVHVLAGSRKGESIVGVEFTGPRFHRVFVPESPA